MFEIKEHILTNNGNEECSLLLLKEIAGGGIVAIQVKKSYPLKYYFCECDSKLYYNASFDYEVKEDDTEINEEQPFKRFLTKEEKYHIEKYIRKVKSHYEEFYFEE